MTPPKWLTGTNLRWILAALLAVTVVGVVVVRRRHAAPAALLHVRSSRPVPASAEARALLAPIAEGGVVQEWQVHSITREPDGSVYLTMKNAGRTIDVRVMKWAPGSPNPPVRAGGYVVYYNAHNGLEQVGFALARAVGAAIQPHASGPVPADFIPR